MQFLSRDSILHNNGERLKKIAIFSSSGSLIAKQKVKNGASLQTKFNTNSSYLRECRNANNSWTWNLKISITLKFDCLTHQSEQDILSHWIIEAHKKIILKWFLNNINYFLLKNRYMFSITATSKLKQLHGLFTFKIFVLWGSTQLHQSSHFR